MVLCTFNDKAHIGEAIESILAQSFTNFEFIIINDGSTDKTKQIIQSYTDSRIIYLEHPNQGIGFSRNKGMKIAKGKYLAIMDGDDIADKHRLKKQYEWLETHPEIGLCGGSVIMKSPEFTKSIQFLEHDAAIRTYLLFNNPFNHPTCMLQRKLIDQYAIQYQEDLVAAVDYQFLYEVMRYTKAYNIPTHLLTYRWHGNNISILNKTVQFENSFDISFRVFNENLKHDFSKKEHRILSKLFATQPLIRHEILQVKGLLKRLYNVIRTHKDLDSDWLIQLLDKKLYEVYYFHGRDVAIGKEMLRSKLWQRLPFRQYGWSYLKFMIRTLFFRS